MGYGVFGSFIGFKGQNNKWFFWWMDEFLNEDYGITN